MVLRPQPCSYPAWCGPTKRHRLISATHIVSGLAIFASVLMMGAGVMAGFAVQGPPYTQHLCFFNGFDFAYDSSVNCGPALALLGCGAGSVMLGIAVHVLLCQIPTSQVVVDLITAHQKIMIYVGSVGFAQFVVTGVGFWAVQQISIDVQAITQARAANSAEIAAAESSFDGVLPQVLAGYAIAVAGIGAVVAVIGGFVEFLLATVFATELIGPNAPPPGANVQLQETTSEAEADVEKEEGWEDAEQHSYDDWTKTEVEIP